MWRDLQDLLLDGQMAFRVRGWTSVTPTSYHLQKKVTMTPLPKSILHIPSPWGTTVAVDLSLVCLVLECKACGVNPLSLPPTGGELETVPILSTDDWQ